MSIPAKTATYCAKRGLMPTAVEHKTVFTAYDLAQTLRRPLNTIAKTLLVKTDSGFTLVVLGADARLDLKKLQALLKTKRLSFSSEKDMVKAFAVKPGAITAFGGLHHVPVALDARFAAAKRALFPSGSFTDSLELSLTQYLKAEQPLVGRFSVKSDLKLQGKPGAKKRAKRPAAKKLKKSKPKAKSR